MIDENASQNALRSAAVDWVQRLESGRVTAADIAALKAWREQSPAHEAAFVDASRLWKTFVPAAHNLRARGELPRALTKRMPFEPVLGRRALLAGGLAAVSAAAAYAVVRPPFELWPSLAELSADYRTATGEQRQLAVSNDVSVHLNTQTSMALRRSDGNVEQIELITGEASFVSRPGQERPLVVLAAGGVSKTSQAHFDIRRSGQIVCITCIDGEVSVALKSQVATLGPGQQVTYDDHGLQGVMKADVELVIAWQQGVLIFRRTPLATVVEEINRYRSGRVIVTNNGLAQLAVSGRFRIDHMDEVLLRLNQAFGITSRSLPGGIVLLS
ncbi:DUF4880 domain-containing protein [Microbacteriaceae bacterium K1510]|nr:DUF4880 domain-containing protein [Microbacteriaceae bacterium K1510]